jgi:hypothetical protein
MRPFPGVKLRVSRGHGAGGNPKNGVKRSHRIEPAIEPEYVLVEIGLQVLWLDATMMSSFDPSFQIAENKMDHRQVRLGLVGIATKRQEVMVVSHFRESRITDPSIGAHGSASGHVVFDKAGKHFSAPVGDDAKSQPSRINAAPMLLAVVLARPDLNGADDKSLMMNAASFPARFTADKTFVNFNRMLAADSIPFRTNHTRTELVKYLKRRFVTTKSKLALELDGRLSWDLRGHQVRAPKPRRKWRMARLHDRSGRQRGVDLAAAATKHNRRARCEAVGLPDKSALWARKSARPTNGFEVVSARCIVGEYPLKLRERGGETANVHARNTRVKT